VPLQVPHVLVQAERPAPHLDLPLECQRLQVSAKQVPPVATTGGALFHNPPPPTPPATAQLYNQYHMLRFHHWSTDCCVLFGLSQRASCSHSNKSFHKMHTGIAKGGASMGKRCSNCPNADCGAVFNIFKDCKDRTAFKKFHASTLLCWKRSS